MQRWQFLAPALLRYGLGLVMVWFGVSQLLEPSAWLGFLPAWTKSLPISQTGFIYLNSWLELFLGLALIVGFYTRLVAAVLALHLAGIVLSLGYTAIAVRDFGLTLGLVSVFFRGPDELALDSRLDQA